MLIVSHQTNAVMERQSASDFVAQVIVWLRSLPELHGAVSSLSEPWVFGQIDEAGAQGIESEDAVARYCRLRLLHDSAWFAAPEQQEILQSERDGNLKVFQLECRDEGVVDGPETVSGMRYLPGSEAPHAQG